MKQEFSTIWRASRQPRKQRKYMLNAPLHLKKKLMASTLSKELRKKHNIRSIEVRKGDEVEVMRGKFKKKKGKVTEVSIKKMKVAVEGLQRSKRDGTKVNLWFNPSKIKINELNLEDKKRLKVKKEKEENAPNKK